MPESVRSGALELEYDLSTGTFSMSDTQTGLRIFESACAAIKFARDGKSLCTRKADSRLASNAAGGLVVAHNFKNSPFALELNIEPLDNAAGFKLRLTLENDGRTEPREIDFFPLSLDCTQGATLLGHGEKHDYRFLRNGFLTWSGSEVRRSNETLRRSIHSLIHDMVHNPTVPIPRSPGHFIGEWYGAVHDTICEATLITGFITTADQLSQIDFKSREGKFHHLRAVSHGENMPLKAGGSLSSEELLILAVSGAPDENDANPDKTARDASPSYDTPLKTYARLASQNAPAPECPNFPSPPVGWCSWYFYYEKMTGKVILENLEAAESLADRLPINVFQIDDGYQPAPGDWLKCNNKFPNGLEWLSRKIRNAGFTPGLWTAPFFATHRSELFRKHRDWFVKREGGGPRPVGIWPHPDSFGIKYALDTTNPEAIRWLQSIFRTIVHDWGYDYLKLDFMFAGATDGERYDTTATRAQAFRRGLEAIRSAAGDNTYIVGCGMPIALGLGIVNGMRISGDTAPYWSDPFQNVIGHPAAPGIPGTAQMNFTRYFINKFWGYNDPDCLMCRFEDTKLSRDETLTHAAIIALTGGPLFISDNLAKLGTGSIRLAQRLIPPIVESAVPVDLFDGAIPATLVKKFNRSFDPVTIVGRFNWSGSTADLPIDFVKIGLNENDEFHVYDLWEDHYHGIHRGRIMMPRVPKHASRVLSIRPVARTPHVVATTFHFTQGGIDLAGQEFDAAARQLKLTLNLPCLRSGKIYIYCPDGYVPGACLIKSMQENYETILRHITSRLFKLEFSMEDSADITITF